MQIIIIVILAIVYFLVTYYNRNKLIYAVLYIGFLSVILSVAVSVPSSLNYRYKETIRNIKSINLKNENVDARYVIWKHGINVIKDNFLIGTGIGDAKDEINKHFIKYASKDIANEEVIGNKKREIQSNSIAVAYLQNRANYNKVSYQSYLHEYTKKQLKIENKKYREFVKRKYNFHNQYLQIFATLGFLGVILILYLLANSFFLTIQNKQLFLSVFVFIIAASFFTESMLERQAGVSFFAFFYSMLFSQPIKSKPS
jgi:O-antigen ligase